jgi:N-dimethylarginine dimethylaminohydrolase
MIHSKLVMCPPEHFENAAKIFCIPENFSLNQLKISAEWQSLYDLLTKDLKQTVDFLPPVKGLSGMVLAADAGVVRKRAVIRSNFRQKGRVGEEIFWEKYFKKQGCQVRSLEKPLCLEGGSDTVTMNHDCYGVIRSQADHDAFEAALTYLRLPFFPLELCNPKFRRLDFCFCPLNQTSAMIFPEAFERCSQMILRENIPDLIEVSEREALLGACGALLLDRHIVIPDGCPETAKELEARQLIGHILDWRTFAELGCGPSALVLKL